jgi:hypothetical protein
VNQCKSFAFNLRALRLICPPATLAIAAKAERAAPLGQRRYARRDQAPSTFAKREFRPFPLVFQAAVLTSG